LFALVARQVERLGKDVKGEVSSWGVRFRVENRTLCELSPFGALFRVRVGEDQAIEYRVRNETIALRALDQVLREYLQDQTGTRPNLDSFGTGSLLP